MNSPKDESAEFVKETLGFFMMIQHPTFQAAYEDAKNPHHLFAAKTMEWLRKLTPTIHQLAQEGMVEFGPKVFELQASQLKTMAASMGLGGGMMGGFFR